MRQSWRSLRIRWTVGGVLVAALLAGSGAVYALTAAGGEASAAASTAAVERGVVSAAVATTGSLEPAETRSLSFSVTGTVTRVEVRPGDPVESGQVLAEIDDSDAQERVEDAEDELGQAKDARQEARGSEDDVTSGDGTACLASDPEADTGAAVPVAAMAAESSLQTPSPSPSPSPSSSPSPSPSPSPSASASPSAPAGPSPSPSPESPPASGGSSSAPGGEAPEGVAPTADPSQPGGTGTGQDCAGAEPGASGSGGDPIFQAEQRVIEAEQQLAEAEDDLAGTRTKAVIAGDVLTVAGEVGSEVSGGSTFITLADVVGMQVAANFPEADAATLETGQSATVTLPNYPGEEYPARVVEVDPVGTTEGTMVTYGVVLAFEEAPSDLLVGQSANVRITTASADEVLRVPTTALREDGTVRVDTADGVVTRTVEIGLRGDQYAEIRSGLREGDQVVISRS